MSICKCFDFTIPKNDYNHKDVLDVLLVWCKTGIFQLEKGDTSGYIHFQGRVSLKKKLRLSTLIGKKLFNGVHWSITSKSNMNNYEYVTKDHTRIEGPWKVQQPLQKTKQMELFSSWELRTFQQAIINEAAIFDMRKIDLVYDTIGNCGKSLLSEWMEYQGLAEEVPPYRLMDDIFQWIATRPIKKCYIIDMPRGMKKDKLGDFYSGVEVIKNGVAYDKRYKALKVRFDRPRIFVFTNSLPAFELMSRDRWRIWTIKKDYTFSIQNVDEFEGTNPSLSPYQSVVRSGLSNSSGECLEDAF